MSTSSERKAMGETLAAYALMKPHEVASFLRVSVTKVKEYLDAGVIPSIGSGKCRRVDPLDVCVYALAQREKLSVADYWKKHGDAVPQRAAGMYRAIREMQAAA